jgi:signal transduction histidine kinase
MKKNLKIYLVSTLVAIISILHYQALWDEPSVHLIHRELFFVPIVLSSFWFGFRTGMIVAGMVCLIYVPHIFFLADPHTGYLAVGFQVAVFILVGGILGWLSGRKNRQQQEMIQVENITVLGRAAAAVGYEMHDLLSSLRNLSESCIKDAEKDNRRDFEKELARLENMVDVLRSYVPRYRVERISMDLNEIITVRTRHHRPEASKRGVRLETRLDDLGCPSQVKPEQIAWVLDNLIRNALEISEAGKTIRISTHRGGDTCRVNVRDNGPGIAQEHLPKIFGSVVNRRPVKSPPF